MKTAFTPGPWFVVQGDEWTDSIATETPEQGIWTVASANKRRDEFEANKNLIAAAPDLYGALEDVLKMDALNGTVMKIYIRDALAKARGEQP